MFIPELLKQIEKDEEARGYASPVRLSNTGKCPCATWFQLVGCKRPPLDGRVILMFRTGDHVESTYKFMAEKYIKELGWAHFIFGEKIQIPTTEGETEYFYKQIDVSLKVGDAIIPGHLDGIGMKTWNDPYVLEFKSMSNYAYEQFTKGIIDESYLWQVQAYMEATGINKTLMAVQRKETGHPYETVIERNKEKYDVFMRWADILAAKTQVPLRELNHSETKEGRKKLDYPCSYCPFAKLCYSGCTVEFTPKGKPVTYFNDVNTDALTFKLAMAEAQPGKTEEVKQKEKAKKAVMKKPPKAFTDKIKPLDTGTLVK